MTIYNNDFYCALNSKFMMNVIGLSVTGMQVSHNHAMNSIENEKIISLKLKTEVITLISSFHSDAPLYLG